MSAPIETKSTPGYGSRRLYALICEHASEPVSEILRRCMDHYASFRRSDADDITLILLRRREA